MQITSRFTIAVHILTAIDYFKDMDRVNSDFLAGSVGVNPVIVRTVISKLREAGILNTQRGSSGAELVRPLDEITFYDVYEAIEPVENGDLFRFHENPNPECPVGRNIHKLLDQKLQAIQGAMEDEMKRYTIEDLRSSALELIANE